MNQAALKNKKVCILLMDNFFWVFFGWLKIAKFDQRFFQTHRKKYIYFAPLYTAT